jgi:hypothetical protein
MDAIYKHASLLFAFIRVYKKTFVYEILALPLFLETVYLPCAQRCQTGNSCT